MAFLVDNIRCLREKYDKKNISKEMNAKFDKCCRMESMKFCDFGSKNMFVIKFGHEIILFLSFYSSDSVKIYSRISLVFAEKI